MLFSTIYANIICLRTLTKNCSSLGVSTLMWHFKIDEITNTGLHMLMGICNNNQPVIANTPNELM